MKSKAIKLAVVGRGLIGSAAARHLSKMGHEVTLIGPSEPTDYAHHDGVFGSHYDEGRITRRLEPHPYWMQMNRASISRYGEVAAESAIGFYREVGVLHIGASDSPDVALIGEIADAAGIPCEAFEDASLAKRFPFLRSTKGMRGFFEPVDAGYISPRRLVQAQTVAARRAGARIIDEPALRISECGSGVTIKGPIHPAADSVSRRSHVAEARKRSGRCRTPKRGRHQRLVSIWRLDSRGRWSASANPRSHS